MAITFDLYDREGWPISRVSDINTNIFTKYQWSWNFDQPTWANTTYKQHPQNHHSWRKIHKLLKTKTHNNQTEHIYNYKTRSNAPTLSRTKHFYACKQSQLTNTTKSRHFAKHKMHRSQVSLTFRCHCRCWRRWGDWWRPACEGGTASCRGPWSRQ